MHPGKASPPRCVKQFLQVFTACGAPFQGNREGTHKRRSLGSFAPYAAGLSECQGDCLPPPTWSRTAPSCPILCCIVALLRHPSTATRIWSPGCIRRRSPPARVVLTSPRARSLSFANQTKYYLDLTGRSFRCHHSFLSMILNIIQRRTTHLQIYLTVRRPRFQSVVSKLAAVKSDVIRCRLPGERRQVSRPA